MVYKYEMVNKKKRERKDKGYKGQRCQLKELQIAKPEPLEQ